MTVDREQVREDALAFDANPRLGDHCLALLAELEQAERERDLAREEVRLREESQISVLPRAAAECLIKAEARLAKVPALVEALKLIEEKSQNWEGEHAAAVLKAWNEAE